MCKRQFDRLIRRRRVQRPGDVHRPPPLPDRPAPTASSTLDDILSYILSHDGVWKTTADEITDYYLENYYDDTVAFIEERKAASR